MCRAPSGPGGAGELPEWRELPVLCCLSPALASMPWGLSQRCAAVYFYVSALLLSGRLFIAAYVRLTPALY